MAAPNVLLIVTDDQPAGMVLPDVMPNVAWLARTGLDYPNAFVTTPLCCPSRVSILTGLYAHNHGVHLNSDHPAVFSRMVQTRLRAAGYRTGLFGRFLNSTPLDENPFGFDTWATIDTGGYADRPVNINGTLRTVPGYYTSILQHQALKFLNGTEATDAKPWFMMLATVAPHRPSTPAPEDVRRPMPFWAGDPALLEQDLADKPGYIKRSPAQEQIGRLIQEQMLRSLVSVDRLVGAIVDRLRQSRELGSTLIIFTSDNGFSRGQHHWKGKLVPYSDSIQVPLILRYPGHVKPGTGTRLALNIDITPTILDATGVGSGTGLDGRSLLRQTYRQAMLGELWLVPGKPVPAWNSIRTATYQYTEYSGGRFREYYDLLNDPWQLTNLLADGVPGNEPDVVALHSELTRLQTCRGRSCRIPLGPPD